MEFFFKVLARWFLALKEVMKAIELAQELIQESRAWIWRGGKRTNKSYTYLVYFFW